ncbi:MAG: 7-cyano-7-deazaguanine synthase QueC [Anaerolineaceae bacterium]|nr:7-cyano-7-deazaguanine synthase QueC [Anaerolineaceae bacterium]
MNEGRSDSVVILSGGFDSTTLLYYLHERKRIPAVITFKYGQRHNKEVRFAQMHTQSLGLLHMIVDLSPLQDLWLKSSLVNKDMEIPSATHVSKEVPPSTYVPNRNMIFLSLAIAWAETLGVQEVFYGAQKHDIYGYWDTTSEFTSRVNAVYDLQPNQILIRAPFVNFTKTDILQIGLKIGVDYSKTWSCYRGEDLACGNCPTCAERLKAFHDVGIKDPLHYQ